jgi:response regulator NasT
MTRLSVDTGTRARWRVALLGLTGESLSTVTAAVTDAGGQVTVEAPARLDSLSLVADSASDVIVLQPSRTAGPRPDLLPFAELGRPLVLFTHNTSRFTHNTSRTLLRVAARSGVAAFLVAPLQPAQLAPTLDLAVARFSDREVLRQKLADRKVIERAKGRLMTVARLSEDDAFRWLRTRAMQTRSTLADVANTVLGVVPAGTPATHALEGRPARRLRATPSALDGKGNPRNHLVRGRV